MTAAGQILIPDKICISTLPGGPQIYTPFEICISAIPGGQMPQDSPHGWINGAPRKAFSTPQSQFKS